MSFTFLGLLDFRIKIKVYFIQFMSRKGPVVGQGMLDFVEDLS